MPAKMWWTLLRTGAIALWLAAVVAGSSLYPSWGPAAWVFLAIIAAIHLFEIPFVLRFDALKQLSRPRTALLTLIFGFTWWLPLKRGVTSRT